MGSSYAMLVLQALAVAVAVAFALALWIVLRRASQLVAETRRIDSFRRAIEDIATRSATSIDGVTARIDAVRRQTLPPQALAENLAAATDAMERYAGEAEALRGPRGFTDIRDPIVAELRRGGPDIEAFVFVRAVPDMAAYEELFSAALDRGVHLRVGLGDNPRLFATNRAAVEHAAALAASRGLTPVTPAELRTRMAGARAAPGATARTPA